MDLRDCLRAVRRRLWLAATAVAAALGTAAGLTTMAAFRLALVLPSPAMPAVAVDLGRTRMPAR